ncbi:pathogenesis-related protein 1-like [Musa acuminata AAA Group]|uniref:Pathogenesis-related protein 1 n=1 Tax=Musa acuminata AAA Group TaxID=214697 RepID=W0FE88_MUSAC|nr:pathogenesis-related protein 1 [Musa acuminata AAA Group]
MASGSWTLEIESSVEASRLFKAAVLDWHSLAPKIAPEIVVSGAVIEGEGSVGAVRQLNFSPALPFGYVKERLDFVDMDKFECKQTLVEGGHIGSKLETATSHFKFQPTAGGGCVLKVVTTYKLLPGAEDDQGETMKSKETVTGIIKAAEAYLLANPDAYL